MGIMPPGLGGGEAGRAVAAIVKAAEMLDWNAWVTQEGGAQIAPGERLILSQIGFENFSSDSNCKQPEDVVDR